MGYRVAPSCIAPTRYNTADRSNLTVIILAANIGYGMKSYGPKTLLAVNEKETILEYQISLVRSCFPKADIILVVGFLADKIIRKCPPGIRVVENQLFENTNEATQLRLALNCAMTDSILVIKDDIIFNNDTLTEISKGQSCLIYDSKHQLDEENIGVNVVDGKATAFAYGLPNKWCHIAYLTSKELKAVKALCNNKDNCKLYLFEILKLLLDRTDGIRAIEPTNMEIIKIDNSRDLDKLKV
jgi:choline kinase